MASLIAAVIHAYIAVYPWPVVLGLALVGLVITAGLVYVDLGQKMPLAHRADTC